MPVNICYKVDTNFHKQVVNDMLYRHKLLIVTKPEDIKVVSLEV